MIIAVLNPKGGCGKTTLATNVARCLHDRGYKTLLVDSDPQGADWHAAREDNPLPFLAHGKPENFKALPGIAQPYAFVLVDGAAKLEGMNAAALKVAGRVLIPVQPSPYDIWAVSDLVELIRARQEVTDGQPKTAFLISRAVRRCPQPRSPLRAGRLSLPGLPGGHRAAPELPAHGSRRPERLRGRQPGGGPGDQYPHR